MATADAPAKMGSFRVVIPGAAASPRLIGRGAVAAPHLLCTSPPAAARCQLSSTLLQGRGSSWVALHPRASPVCVHHSLDVRESSDGYFVPDGWIS